MPQPPMNSSICMLWDIFEIHPLDPPGTQFVPAQQPMMFTIPIPSGNPLLQTIPMPSNTQNANNSAMKTEKSNLDS